MRVAFIGVILAGVMVGCSSRMATPAEERQIWAAVASYHNAVVVAVSPMRPLAATQASTAPAAQVGQDRGMIWEGQIRIGGNSAAAKFMLHTPMSQFAAVPQKAVLVYESGQWTVRESRSNTSLMYDVLNYTVGVK